MKLSEFCPKDENCENRQEKKQKNQENIENLYEKYKNYNSDELLNELYKNVAKQKNDGTFDYQNIKNTISNVLPYLNESQKNNLMTILEKIQ